MSRSYGLTLALGAACSYSFQSLLFKLLSSDVPAHNVAVYRSSCQILFLWPILNFFFGDTLQTERVVELVTTRQLYGGLFLRSFCGYSALMTQFLGLRYISLGDSGAIRALVIPVTAVMAYFLLGERIERKEMVPMADSFLGIGLAGAKN